MVISRLIADRDAGNVTESGQRRVSPGIMKRRNFILGGGLLATLSLGTTSTSASLADAVSTAADFRVLSSSPEVEVDLDPSPRTPNDESTHTWQLDNLSTQQNVDSITLNYSSGTGVDGISTGDVDLDFGGSSPTASAVGSAGSSVTIQLDQPTAIGGSATVTITDAVVNPAVGTYTSEIVFSSGSDELSFTTELQISDGPPADEVYDIRRESFLEDREYIFELSQGYDPTWDFGDGTTSTSSYVRHTYSQDGTYDVTLTVTIGGEEYSYADTVEVDTTPSENGPPADDVFDIRQEDYLDDREYILEISTSNGVSVADPRWDFDDGTTTTGYYNTHTYAEDGSYEVSLIVDIDGQDYIYYETLDVSTSDSGSGSDDGSSNDGPPADQVYTIRQEPWLGDREYIFEIDSGYEPAWNLGDGTTSTGYYVTHAYDSAGTYDITLDITISGTQYTYTDTLSVD